MGNGRKADTLLPGYRVRHDGWTPQRQRMFLRALGETACVRDACARARISDTSAYRMRQRSAAFAQAWDRALAKAAPTIEQAAFERAVLGWDEPVWHGGKLVGHRRRYSDNLLRLLLTRQNGRARTDDEPYEEYRATQAETDAMLLARLRALREQRRAEPAALSPPPPARREGADARGDGDAGGDDRNAADHVRDGDDA